MKIKKSKNYILKIFKKNPILNKLINKFDKIKNIKKKINKILPKNIKKQYSILNIIQTSLIIEVSKLNWKIYIEKNKKKILKKIKKNKIKKIYIKLNPNIK